jgi:hypothetical protein
MTPFRGQASWAKIMSLLGKLAALVLHLTKKSSFISFEENKVL